MLSIVFLIAVAQQPRPLRLIEEARWGGSAADTLIPSQPSAAALHRSGTLAVVLPQSGSVLFRSGAGGGAQFRQLGRTGQGPGEFTRPVSTGWQGDSLWVFDFGLNRVTWLDREGKLLGSEQGKEAGGIYPLRDGTWLRFSSSGLEDSSAQVFLIEQDRKASRRVLTYSWPKSRMLQISGQGQTIVGIQPFAPRAVVLVDPRGELVAIEPTTNPGAVRIRRVTPNGNPIAEQSVTLPTQALTDALFDAAVSRMREGGGREHRALPEEVVRKAINRPSHLPAVRGQLIADDGTLWLQAGAETATLTTWTLLDRNGKITGTVTGPPQLKLLAVTGGKVIGALTDADGLTAIVQYRTGRS